jgi:hypothetical protein
MKCKGIARLPRERLLSKNDLLGQVTDPSVERTLRACFGRAPHDRPLLGRGNCLARLPTEKHSNKRTGLSNINIPKGNMFKIHKDQMAVFEQEAMRRFECRTARYIEEVYPQPWKYLGEQQISIAIRYGLARAMRYGLSLEQNALYYIDVMFMLGSGFDEDPQYPWAVEILEDPEVPDETLRAELLYDSAVECICHATKDFENPDGDITKSKFFEELRQFRYGRDTVLWSGAIPELIHQVKLRLTRVFSHKYKYLGEEALSRAIEHSIDAASSYNLRTERGVSLFALLMAALGAGFVNDPLVPWVKPLFTDVTLTDSAQKADGLYIQSVIQLERWARGE